MECDYTDDTQHGWDRVWLHVKQDDDEQMWSLHPEKQEIWTKHHQLRYKRIVTFFKHFLYQWFIIDPSFTWFNIVKPRFLYKTVNVLVLHDASCKIFTNDLKFTGVQSFGKIGYL